MSGSISVDFVGHQFSETAEIVLADIKISVKAGELVFLSAGADAVSRHCFTLLAVC